MQTNLFRTQFLHKTKFKILFTSPFLQFKDFLLLYNQISETCFKTCANTFLSREITSNEDLCVNNCAQKYIHANHKIMEVFMEVQPLMMHKRIEEINTAQTILEEQNQQIKLEENPQ